MSLHFVRILLYVTTVVIIMFMGVDCRINLLCHKSQCIELLRRNLKSVHTMQTEEVEGCGFLGSLVFEPFVDPSKPDLSKSQYTLYCCSLKVNRLNHMFDSKVHLVTVSTYLNQFVRVSGILNEDCQGQSGLLVQRGVEGSWILVVHLSKDKLGEERQCSQRTVKGQL